MGHNSQKPLLSFTHTIHPLSVSSATVTSPSDTCCARLGLYTNSMFMYCFLLLPISIVFVWVVSASAAIRAKLITRVERDDEHVHERGRLDVDRCVLHYPCMMGQAIRGGRGRVGQEGGLIFYFKITTNKPQLLSPKLISRHNKYARWAALTLHTDTSLQRPKKIKWNCFIFLLFILGVYVSLFLPHHIQKGATSRLPHYPYITLNREL